MKRPEDIRKTVSKTYASAVERTKATGSRPNSPGPGAR